MIEVGNLMVKKEYVLHIVDKLKCGIKSEIRKKTYEAALELILNGANILYQTNLYYVDEDLEGYLKEIANKMEILSPIGEKTDVIFFYDGFGLNSRGLAQIYIKALCQIKKVIYITYEDCKENIPDIQNIINKNDGRILYINRRQKNYTEQILQLCSFASEFKPHDFFFYSFPNDVVGVTSLNILEGKVTRYQINLTDHAFWLGARCIDKCIEFRDYGANVSVKYRGICKNIIAKLPFYPIINKDIPFQGFPFEIVNGQKVVFSGGALYKTFGGENKYYDIIDNILKKYKEVVFWYAGSGDDSKLKELMKKYPGRIFHTLERNDLFQTLQHCRFYLNTYPICGGLMYQYAALAGIVPVTLRHDEDADGYLLNQEKLVVDFENEADLYQEVDKLICDDEYFYERRNQLRRSVVSEEEFMCNLKEIMNNNDIMEINYTDINTDVFRSEYLNRISQYDIDSFFISKKTIKTILKYFPMHVLRGIIKKLISKCK